VRRRPFGRDTPEQDARAAIMRSIRTIRAQQQELDRRAGSAYAGVARVEQELQLQRRALAEAGEQIRLAVAAAEHAAASARADGGEAAAAPYQLTAEGLRAQLDVIAASGAQLDGLQAGTRENTERTRALLAENRRRLGAALHEQVALLARLEELERKRLVAESLRKHHPPSR
jgi:chromosome segregation ATPase